MDPARIVHRLKADAGVFRALLEDVSEDQARWKPGEGKWSLLEVINHLADEEREDFRRRLDLTLHHPGTPWPPIDPEGWVVERRYNHRDLAASLSDFLAERRESVRWLGALLDSGGSPGSGVSDEVEGRTPGGTPTGDRESARSPEPPSPDWNAVFEHPKLGPVSAGDLLTSWLAHDLIHVRQMNRLHREYLTAVLSGHSPEYAGRW